MSWSERIPAAIEKAEGLLGGCDVWLKAEFGQEGIRIDFAITKTEVALAKALWDMYCWIRSELPVKEGTDGIEVHAALRAFVEKVEAL